jgi:hypothetical protein
MLRERDEIIAADRRGRPLYPGSPIKVFFKTGSRYTANAANTLKLNGGAEGGGVTLQVTGPTETVTPPPPPATPSAVFVLDSVSEIEVAKRAAAAAYKANLEDAQNGGLFNTIGLTGQVKSTPQGEEILDVLEDATGGLGEVIEKSLKIVGKATATTFYVGAYVEFLLAKDPPRSDFTVIATLAKPKGARLKAQRALPARTAKALNALHANSAGVGAAATAFVISLERAQGAVAARDSASESKQVAAAADFATKWARHLNRRAKLARRLVAALKSTGSRFKLTARQVKDLPRLYRKALPGGLLKDLDRFGLTTAQAKQARKTYRKAMARRRAKSLRFPVSLQSRNAARTDTKLATALRTLAARLQVIAAATKD